MLRIILTTGLALVPLSGCMTQTPSPNVESPTAKTLDINDPLYQKLAGKRMQLGDEIIIYHPDGTMTGEGAAKEFKATWWVEDGKFCRTVTAPADWAGTNCRTVTFNGNQVTHSREDGSGFTFTVLN